MPARKMWCIVPLLLIPHLALASYCPPAGKRGIWSREATYLCSAATKEGFTRNIDVYSPDHRKAVRVTNDHWSVLIGERIVRLSLQDSYVSYYPAELAWSSDSTMFYITQSDATSEINGFHTEIYRVDEQTVSPLPGLQSAVQGHFRERHKCDEEDYNIAGLSWAGGSNDIIIIAEIPPDSVCGPRGYFGGYVISTAEARIIRQYTPQELFQRWGKLFGSRIRENYANLTPAERRKDP